MSSSIPTASYTALQEKDEIRLLHLQPGTEASPIICNIHHIQLSQEPRYEALSYQWGSEAPLKTIELNNQPRYVRSNLYFALQHLRRRRKARVLWVDALCINQENDVERSHQVFQMGSIYSHARQVCVWLGLADTCAYGVARLLRRKELSEEVKQGIIRRPEEWYDMAEFCKREYWDRLWIIQEVELARKIEVYCGHLHFPWEVLSDTLCSFDPTLGVAVDEGSGRTMPCESFGFCGSIMRSTTAALCRERRQRKQTTVLDDLSLLALLRKYRKANCTDVRDKIFGLHSFAPACCIVANPVDFTCSAWELCNKLLDHHYSCHEPFVEVATVLDRSKELHSLLMGGALQQKGSSYAFPVHSEEINKGNVSSSSDLTGYRYTEIIFISQIKRYRPRNYDGLIETTSGPWTMTTQLEVSLHSEPNIIESFSSKGKLTSVLHIRGSKRPHPNYSWRKFSISDDRT